MYSVELHGRGHVNESICRFIYSPAGRKLRLSRYLPHHHSKRGYRRRKAHRNIPIPDRVAIDRRPESANGKAIWSTSRAKVISCSRYRNASPAIGS